MKRNIIYPLTVLLVLLAHVSYAQVWQWSVSVDSVVSGETGDHPRAYLWIPENCRRVRAVVFAQHNMIEEGMLERPLFRRTMKELGIAEVWVTPGIDMSFDFNKGAGRGFDRMMQLLADRSGYVELAAAPVIPMGHSAYATFPWNFAAWAPGRTLALLSIHGDAPQTRLTGYGGANVDWGGRNIDGVPALFVMGEYEWWEDRIAPAFKYVSEHPHAAISLFCDAGHGHFDYSDEMVAYVCMFIRKAARLRLPAAATTGGLYTLKSIDPGAGWRMDRWRKDSLPVAPAAPYGAYKGDRYYSSWVFDKEMAMATERFYALSRGRRRQFIGFQQQGRVLRPERSHAEYTAKFEPLADGVSFHLKAFFADASRTEAVEAFAQTPPEIDRICGPVSKVNDTTFRVSFNRLGFDNPKRSFDIWLLAHSNGDKTFKSAVQQLNMKIPPQNREGVEQSIRFDGIADQPAGKKAIPLHAVSSAGLPVCFYVREGPAYIDGDSLRFTRLPSRTRFPVEVTVVVWQYGIAGKFRTAVPVTHSFYLTRPERVTRRMSVVSPDGSTVLEAGNDRNGYLRYRMLVRGKAALDWSALGIDTGKAGGEGKVRIGSVRRVRRREVFPWVFGERDSIVNDYAGVMMACAEGPLRYAIEARVYDGSIAFRYVLPVGGSAIRRLRKERTSFHFPASYTMYQYNQESVFTPTDVDTLGRTCDLPATLTNGDQYVLIGEACNDGFTKAELRRGTVVHSLEVAYVRDTVVNIDGPGLTPWRTVSVSGTAVGLHAFSDLNYRLNPPPGGPVAGTVRPGKLIRSQLSTQAGLDCIDFAVRHNLQYIMFDAGWYGAEFRTTSDPTVCIAGLDLPKVIGYGKERGIGVILYVNYVGLRARLDTILQLYRRWGVAGLKFGFVDGLTQHGIEWLHDAIRKVNAYGFVLDIHDNYKPTGLSRTYPALLTQEGIRGDENGPDAYHTLVLPFTRFLAGPADFTFCYPNAKESFSRNLKVSKAHQLALSVVYYSPLQSLYWYGKPLDYTNDGEIEFFDLVPTVWDESCYLAGEIGGYVSVARRHGREWFMGSVAGRGDWDGSVSLGFLAAGVRYRATVYEDDGMGGIRKTTLDVKKGDVFPLHIRAGGGQAVVIRPAG